MKLEIDDQLIREVCDLQTRREQVVEYPKVIRWLALAKNVGEAFDCYFRQNDHYRKELADALINILMILGEEDVDLSELVKTSLSKTRHAIIERLKVEEAEG